MTNFYKSLICFYSVVIISSPFVTAFKCYLPDRCHLQKLSTFHTYDNSEKAGNEFLSIMCNINDNSFEFNFKQPMPLIEGEYCNNSEPIDRLSFIVFRWTKSKELNLLDDRLNLLNLFTFIGYFQNRIGVNLWGLNGIDLNILDKSFAPTNFKIFYLELANCRLDFYYNKEKVDSCEDIRHKSTLKRFYSVFNLKYYTLILKNVEFKRKICPLLFEDSEIYIFILTDLLDTFYKKNIFQFYNRTTSNSRIRFLTLQKVYDINIDLNLLHPSVFNQLGLILIEGFSLNSIDENIFREFHNLYSIQIDPIIFKKIIHKQGIAWIRQWNRDINASITSSTDYSLQYKSIRLTYNIMKQRNRISKIFPEEDFCIYVDFPFNQLITVYEIFTNEDYNVKDEFMNATWNAVNLDNEITCTYLWLVQYYKFYNTYYSIISKNVKRYLAKVMNSKAFKSISKCNFGNRINLCRKSSYHIMDILDENDFLNFNKKLQIIFKISLYPISLFGLFTNFIVVIVILKKDNTDLFKEFKQYTYLYLNSIFCMVILLIELLSWMTECFYPFEVFCPEIRKLVAIQFFKIIFKECLVIIFIFMCNFTYVAFSLNRISLIGKKHGKLVTFASEVGIKKYIIVTFFISLSFSWAKFFKYKVNYFYPDTNFPIPNESNIIISRSNRFKDFYLTFNLISDMVNYLLFVSICIVIDICMVVQLRRTLNEKAKKTKEMNQKQSQSKTSEYEEVVNKAIKMVVLNSVIGILFKLPVCFIPLLNVSAEFYFKNLFYKYFHPSFGDFYSFLFYSGFYALIQDVSHFLFTLSLSIQMFIYNRFDKKFRAGYERLRDQALLYIKNRFNFNQISS